MRGSVCRGSAYGERRAGVVAIHESRPISGHRDPVTIPPVNQPTRQEQAVAILEGRARQLASRVLGRRANNQADFTEAFNLERVDLLSEITDETRLLGLGRNRVGPHNGLYVLIDDDGTYRCYLQERGESTTERRGMSFSEARDYVIDLVIQAQGLPYTPAG